MKKKNSLGKFLRKCYRVWKQNNYFEFSISYKFGKSDTTSYDHQGSITWSLLRICIAIPVFSLIGYSLVKGFQQAFLNH